MGIFDNLSKFGIKNMDSSDMYNDGKEESKTAKVEEPENKAPEIKESDFVFQKSYDCPVCSTKFQSLTLKSNKARLVHSDKDLRPIYDFIEPIKYEVVSCPVCGYSVMARYMAPLTPTQKKSVIENISTPFSGGTKKDKDAETVSYEEAHDRISLALACAMVKRAKASEKAYICLKGGWLCRSYGENLDPTEEGYAEKKKMLEEQEEEFLRNAYDGFLQARTSEPSPIAGMDDNTISYLLAVFASKYGEYETASKMIASILQSPSAPTRLKDKARDLKEELIKKIKEKQS